MSNLHINGLGMQDAITKRDLVISEKVNKSFSFSVPARDVLNGVCEQVDCKGVRYICFPIAMQYTY